MRQTLALILTLLLATPAVADNLVLLNGTIIDGSGNRRTTGNLRIRDGEIVDVGVFKPLAGETTVDVNGLIVAPGFIDLHGRSGSSPAAQGITTSILGHEGEGPIAVEDFMLPFDRDSIAINIATFVGHRTVRVHEMGDDNNRMAVPNDIKKMEVAVEYGMREGAFGLSAGFENPAGPYVTVDELAALARVAARYGGFFVTVLRDSSAKVLESVKEAIDIARRAKAPVHISGLTGNPAQVLPLIDRARIQGLDVTADVRSGEKAVRDFLQNRSVMVAGEETFPFVLRSLVRDKSLTLESAVRKMSALPAARMSLRERGALKKGNAADVIVFDPAATAQGMKYVFVNGVMVVNQGQPTGATPGRALR